MDSVTCKQKLLWLVFGEFCRKLGLLFLLTSGHTRHGAPWVGIINEMNSNYFSHLTHFPCAPSVTVSIKNSFLQISRNILRYEKGLKTGQTGVPTFRKISSKLNFIPRKIMIK